jgi:hypothetical protein
MTFGTRREVADSAKEDAKKKAPTLSAFSLLVIFFAAFSRASRLRCALFRQARSRKVPQRPSLALWRLANKS